MSQMNEILYFDGCCLPVNPRGIVCAGYAIQLDSGEIIKDAKVISESGTNNQGEYSGLILGLEKALSLGIDRVEAYGDSMLVVNQINREWAVRSPSMQKFCERCRVLIRKLKSFSIEWISREKNWIADEIVHETWLRYFEKKSLEAAKKIDVGSIRWLGGSHFEVTGKKVYRVDAKKISCTCEDFRRKNRYFLLKRSGIIVRCKHLISVMGLPKDAEVLFDGEAETEGEFL